MPLDLSCVGHENVFLTRQLSVNFYHKKDIGETELEFLGGLVLGYAVS